jgi:hypothetical protein
MNPITIGKFLLKRIKNIFGGGKAVKTEITQIEDTLQDLLKKIEAGDAKAEQAFKPLEDIARKIDEIENRNIRSPMELFESIGEPSPGMRKIIEEEMTSMRGGPKNIADEIEDVIKAGKQKDADLARVEEKMADPKNIDKMMEPGGFEKLMQEVQDEKIIPFKPKKAEGGRIGLQLGGIGKLLAKMGMKAPDKVGDVKQTKNIIRDPETDLARGKDTPEGKKTIDELEQMFMDDPRYMGKNEEEILRIIDKEKIRADVSYNLGVEPEEIPDDMIEMLYRDGYHKQFANGGKVTSGVGSLFKRRV